MFFTTACTANKMPLESDTDIYDTKETGSFKKGGFMYSDYWVALEWKEISIALLMNLL